MTDTLNAQTSTFTLHISVPQTAKRPTKLSSRGVGLIPGNGLLSQAIARPVPLALEGVTGLFGMGSGGVPPLKPPGNGGHSGDEASNG